MTVKEAVNWLINLTADIGKSEHRTLWHYEQALIEIKEMLESSCSEIPNSSDCIDRAEAQTAIQFAARRYTVAHEAHGEGHVVWSDNLISVTDAMNALREVPPAQPQSSQGLADSSQGLVNDTISRQDAIDVAIKADIENNDGVLSEKRARNIDKHISALPPAQPERKTEFIKLTVRDSNGKPYYSIIYLEFDNNGVGHDLEGYSSYSLDVISDYLKKYFIPSAQLERPKGEWTKDCACEICGFKPWYERDIHTLSFCPRCGSDMRGKQDGKTT